MARTMTSRLLSALLIISALILISGDRVRSASGPLVPQGLIQKAQSAGQLRVIVELALSAAAQSAVDSDIVSNLRRAEVAQARDSVRASLAGTAHAVVREYQELPFVALEVGVDGLRTLESLYGLVTQVVEDSLNRPFLTQSIPLVQADEVWGGGFGGTPLTGAGTVVAVLDTGVDKNHPFLAGKVVEEACFSSNNAGFGATSVCPGGATSSFASGSGMPCSATIDGCEHGTHVAGIAAGKGQSFSGVARDANLMAVQVFTRFDNPSFCGSSDPCALAFNSDILAGLERVFARRSARNFASVNMSLGGGQNSTQCDSNPMKPVIDLLRGAGIAAVIASGNDGFTTAIASPACISSSVSVGSTGDAGAALDVVSSFSNSASFLSLLAPGSLINSSVTPGTGFANLQGTSMAAPHVAGAFALLKEAGPSLTVGEMVSGLQNTGLPVLDKRNGITKPRIRILNALFDLPLGDVTAPGKVANLKAISSTQTSVLLNWTAPGDDDDTGTATTYDMRFSNAKFTDANWSTLTQASGEPAPQEAGTLQNVTVGNLLCGRSYFFGVKTRDEAANESVLSNIATGKTAKCNKLAVNPKALPIGEAGVAYNSGAFNVTGTPNTIGPFTVQIDPATLPPGVTYNGSQAFTGTPAEAKSYNIAGVITDGVGSALKAKFKVKVAKPVQITTNSLKAGKVNVPYKTTFKAKDGVKAYEWEVITSGLVLGDFEFDKATGKTTLLATSPGTVDLNVKVKSLTGGTANRNLTVEFK